MQESRKILFLAPYPLAEAPSQRFRFEQYFTALPDHLDYDFQSFWTKKSWERLYAKGGTVLKAFYLLIGFLRRFSLLFHLGKYDFIFIHRELTPIGPPLFEFIITHIFKKKVIYDFDDAIWLVNKSNVNRLASYIKFQKKVGYICKWSYKISVGNAFLANYAGRFNNKVIINPTVVDTENGHNRIKQHTDKEQITIGWTGTHSTALYLPKIVPALKKIKESHNIVFHVISNEKPKLDIDFLYFTRWEKDREIEQLLNFDIGIMPLENTQWEQGKCGFKLIQYLSLGIPAVASNVGVNDDIIDHGENGYLAASEEEWVKYLGELISEKEKREVLGKNGRKKIEENYSVGAKRALFFSLFE